jgi:TrmH family RNA methyltransferase
MSPTITSQSNPLVKEIVRLRKQGRDSGEPIIIEGEKEIALAVTGGFKILKTVYCRDYFKADPGKLPGELVEVDKKVFEKIAYREHPDGVLALAEAKESRLADLQLSSNPLIIILEAVEKPGNLGAVLRTADAAGADAVIVCDPKTDIYNSNVIRASLGAVFTVQTAAATSSEVIAWLKTNKIRSFAAVVGAKTSLYDADLRGPAAIVIGAEHEGLSRTWQEAADEPVSIPMAGQVDSLNASVSAAVMVYEAVRQRIEPY